MIKFVATFFLILFIFACSSEESSEDKSGQLTYKCKANNICNTGLICDTDSDSENFNKCKFASFLDFTFYLNFTIHHFNKLLTY